MKGKGKRVVRITLNRVNKHPVITSSIYCLSIKLSPLNRKKTTFVQRLNISGSRHGFTPCSHIATWLHLGTKIPLLNNSRPKIVRKNQKDLCPYLAQFHWFWIRTLLHVHVHVRLDIYYVCSCVIIHTFNLQKLMAKTHLGSCSLNPQCQH